MINDYNEIDNNTIDNLPLKVKIVNKEEIDYREVTMYDGRLDNLIFDEYGVNYQNNYEVSRKLMIYLVLMFNEYNDLQFNSIGSQQKIWKMPSINQMLDNLVIINDKKVNGVYDFIGQPNKGKTTHRSEFINELEARLGKSNNLDYHYDPTTGIITF